MNLMDKAGSKILGRMLDRLFAGLMSGPNLNCRPHASRQRVDCTQLAKLQDLGPEEVVRLLLAGESCVKISAKVPAPKRTRKPADKKSALRSPTKEKEKAAPTEEEKPLTPEEQEALAVWTDQQGVLNKLRILAEEARTYEQDTGVHVLNLGWPLLSLPPGAPGVSAVRGASKRVLAPIAFLPVDVVVRSGPTPTVEITCHADEVDRVFANQALLAWLEQQTGVALEECTSETAAAPAWEEVAQLVRQVADALKLKVPELFAHKAKSAPEEISTPEMDGSTGEVAPEQQQPPTKKKKNADEANAPAAFKLRSAPRGDDAEQQAAIVLAGVLGLFPMNNQGLLRDTQAMQAGESLAGPVESFLSSQANLDQAVDSTYEHASWAGPKKPRVFAEERLVTFADPCQARAVHLAQVCRGLVIHGPPGTGKSQTITNIIGDHLARGQRVLMVCDKRTALDVVANRLDHLGLGSLFAVVHDPRQDQRDLYRKLRDQLENLTDAKSDAWAEPTLAKIDAELDKLHGEASAYWKLLMEKDAHGISFHELVGQWLAAATPPGVNLEAQPLHGANLEELEKSQQDVLEILARAERVQYAKQPWKNVAGISLDKFLSQPMTQVAATLNECVEAAKKADAARSDGIPPFQGSSPLPGQAQARAMLADQLEKVVTLDAKVLGRWAKKDLEAVRRARHKLTAVAAHLQAVLAGPLDAELELLVPCDKLDLAEITRQLGMLESYLEVASKWYGVVFFQRKNYASQVLHKYGLNVKVDSARRLQSFLQGIRARFILQALLRELTETTGKVDWIADPVLLESLSQLDVLLNMLETVRSEAALAGLDKNLAKVLTSPSQAATLVTGLRQSAGRADALGRLNESLANSALFDPAWLTKLQQAGWAGQAAADEVELLAQNLGSLEDVLRIRHGLAQLPVWLRQGLEAWLPSLPQASAGMAAVRKAVLQAVLTARLQANPAYQKVDPQRLATTYARLRELEIEKQAVVRETVRHRWLTRQKERLLVGTGSRLNSMGADLRRRLTMRGEQALRLRQVVSVGAVIEGGDPLFDLAPVWLVSPETVAQVFPRVPLFDVVIFDEASQCRLEEALPVLTRAGRVVIAGDPKQLPPTRFFESTLATSAEEEIETEQQLFEAHQKEIEDLLGAALSLDIQQCYLDVHYRSRNADLIEFSNQQFYSRRLQPIPGHPANRVRFPPITLYRADGVYEDRQNETEAERVCQIVRDLLKRAEPPSIGIACFNLAQRDLIVQKLDELAQTDREFGRRLADARQRRGNASFEGLFVKNLENVQGDERDHIIVSTTYGPDPEGRFYRRFGPLGRAGGGRRLNVLVTRARQEVHLVTSIPSSVYRSLPPIPPGQTAGGSWLLFSYLAYAEHLAEAYEHHHEPAGDDQPAPKPEVHVQPTATPSPFAEAFARRLIEKHQVGSIVHWGNDGFCIDVALAHPRRLDDVTLGVLCDGVRFAQAEDPVEWDLFRTMVLESQGWRLHRLWSPHFFRDVEGNTKKLLREVKDFLAGEKKG